MNKAELIAAVAAKTGLSKADAGRSLDAMLASISEHLINNGSVNLTGFGTFKITERQARQGRHPKTGEPLHIPATRTPGFKPGATLKEAVAKNG